MATWQHFVEAARPKTLPASAAPVLLGTAVAFWQGHAKAGPAALAFVCAGALQVATNYANDYFDAKNGADTDARVGPRRAVQAGLVTPSQMRWATAAAFAVAVMAGAALSWVSSPWLLVVGVACLLAGYLYTGGPQPLGYLGLGDVMVFVFFGPVAVAGTVFVQGGAMDVVAVVNGAGAGLLSTGILVVNNLRDRHTDVLARKNTLAVRLGARFARIEYAACVIIPFACAGWLAFVQQRASLLLPLLSLPLALVLVRRVALTQGAALNPLLGRTAQLLLLFCVLSSAGFVLARVLY